MEADRNAFINFNHAVSKFTVLDAMWETFLRMGCDQTLLPESIDTINIDENLDYFIRNSCSVVNIVYN